MSNLSITPSKCDLFSINDISDAYVAVKITSKNFDRKNGINAGAEEQKRGFDRFRNATEEGDRASILHAAKHIWGMSCEDSLRVHVFLNIRKKQPELQLKDVLELCDMYVRLDQSPPVSPTSSTVSPTNHEKEE